MNGYRALAAVGAAIIFAFAFGLVPVIQWLVTKIAEAVALVLYRVTHLAAIQYRGPSGEVADIGAILLIGVLVIAAITFLARR